GLEHFLATGEGPVLNRRFEIEALHRKEYEFPIELTITSFRVGKDIFFSAFAHDISERRQMENAMLESRERLQRIIDSINHAIIGMDSQWRITDWNLSAEKIFGWSRGEVLGTFAAETIIP